MYKTKKFLSFIVAVAFAMTIMLTGCGDKSEGQAAGTTTDGKATVSTTASAQGESQNLEPVELIYYFGGGQQKDLQAVNDEVSKISKEKINATIKLNLIDWGGYDQKMNVIVSAGEEFDLCFTASWTSNFSYFKNAANGAFLPLDELMDKYAPKTKAGVPENIWSAARVSGKIYGAINYQIMATGYGIAVQKDLADKYNYDWKSIDSYDDLTPFLEAVKKGEPGKIPLEYTNTADLFTSGAPMYNMDCIGDQKSPGWVYMNDANLKVVNQYDSPEFKQLLKVTRDWYNKGYFRKDASTTKDISADRKAAKYAAVCPALLTFDTIDHPDADGSLFSVTSVKWYDKKTIKPIITTDRAAATLTAISATSKNPERAMMFIEMMNSDVQLFNTLCWGVEGTHYTKLSEDQIKLTPDSGYNPQIYWEFGNNLNLWRTEDQKSEYIAAWDNANKSSNVSPLLGFTFDQESVKSEIAQCQSVVDEYLSGLTTGTIDPDKYQPEFIDKLNKAGAEKIVSEKQKQIDAWVASNK